MTAPRRPKTAPRRPHDEHLGVILGRLGASWGHLGAILGHPGAILSRLGAILGSLGPSWSHVEAVLGVPGAILGSLGAVLGILGRSLRCPTASQRVLEPPTASHSVPADRLAFGTSWKYSRKKKPTCRPWGSLYDDLGWSVIRPKKTECALNWSCILGRARFF